MIDKTYLESTNTPHFIYEEPLKRKLSFVSESTLCNIDQLKSPNEERLITEDNNASIFNLSQSNMNNMSSKSKENIPIALCYNQLNDFESKRKFFEEKVMKKVKSPFELKSNIINKMNFPSQFELKIKEKEETIKYLNEEVNKLKQIINDFKPEKPKLKLSANRYTIHYKKNKKQRKNFYRKLSIDNSILFSIMSNKSRIQLISLVSGSKTASKIRKDSNEHCILNRIKEESNSKGDSYKKDEITPHKNKVPLFTNKNMTEIKKKLDLSNYKESKSQFKEGLNNTNNKKAINKYGNYHKKHNSSFSQFEVSKISIHDIHNTCKVKELITPSSAKKYKNSNNSYFECQNQQEESIFNTLESGNEIKHKRLNSTFINQPKTQLYKIQDIQTIYNIMKKDKIK